MKITKGSAYDAAMTIKNIIDGCTQEIPQLAAYRLAKIYTKIQKYGLEVERHMIKMAQQFGSESLDSDGVSQGWKVPEANRKAYNEAVAVLRDEEVEIDANPVPIGAFGTNTANGLQTNQFYHLRDFIEGEPTE